MPGSSRSGPRWQVGYRVSEGKMLSFFFYVEHTVVPAVWWSLKNTWHQVTHWKAPGYNVCGKHPSSQGGVATGTANAGQSQWGSSCTQWMQTSPWARVRQPSRLGEGRKVWLERYSSFVIREQQGQGNSGINFTMALFVCAGWWGQDTQGALGYKLPKA